MYCNSNEVHFNAVNNKFTFSAHLFREEIEVPFVSQNLHVIYFKTL